MGSYLEGQTRGLPPSPLQVSLPLTPPAQTKLSWSLNFPPSLVCLRLSWQVSWSTTGRSISFRTTWYSPAAPNLSFPHPVAKQVVPLKVSPASGRQAVSMWSESSNSGWISRLATCLSWWGLGSVWCWVSHSPHRTFSSLGFCLNLSTQWAAVRTTPGAIRDPPHWKRLTVSGSPL